MWPNIKTCIRLLIAKFAKLVQQRRSWLKKEEEAAPSSPAAVYLLEAHVLDKNVYFQTS